ncbi:MAG: PQQ-binding-like beta-propeller repeat protein [Microthrixaceae bacterium]
MVSLMAATMAVGVAGVVAATAQPVPYSDAPAGTWRVNGRVSATEIIGDTVYVGGYFTSVTGPSGTVARRHLAAFDARTGELRTGFAADTDQPVRALATDGAALFVGGSFNSIRGTTRHRLAKLDPGSGAVNGTFTGGTNSHVYALTVSGDRLYVGGSFSQLSGQPISRVGAVDPASGVAIPSFAPGANASVTGLDTTPDGSEVFVAGQFTTIAGTDRRYVTGLTRDGVVTGPDYVDAVDYVVFQVDYDPQSDHVFVAVAGYGNQLAALDHQTGQKLWRHRADGDVQAVRVDDGTVYFGFHEGFAGDEAVRMLAADTTSGELEAAWRLNATSFMGVFSISADGTTLVAGGELDWILGTNVGGLAILPRNTPPPPPTTTTTTTSTTTTTAPPRPPGEPLVESGSSWRFQVGTAPTGWAEPGFADGAWASGVAELGYGDGDEATTFGPAAATTYFRHSFQLDAVPAGPLTMSVLADDGALVRLNGTEVMRDNLPPGAIGPTTAASGYRWGAGETTWTDVAVDPSLLRVGTNTVAVEVHQAPDSTDLSFDASLTPSGGTPFPPSRVDLVTPGADWRYRIGDAPADWIQPGFADGSWAHGVAELGAADGDEATVIGPVAPTTYFRHSFLLATLPDRPLELSVLADDGAVVYLNGVEVMRDNLPPGAVGPGTAAPAYKWGDAERTWVTVTLDPAQLQPGTNTVAIEVHQAHDSGDLSFDASLAVPA